MDVPVIADGSLIGLLRLAARQCNTFQPNHQEIAREIADALALVISQARILEAEQQRRREFEVVQSITHLMRAAQDQHQLYDLVLPAVRSLMEAESVYIILAGTR
jgi:GAF domain-containing protein